MFLLINFKAMALMFRKTYNFETTFRFLRSFPMICNVCSKNWFRCNSRCVLSINMPNWRRGISKSNRKHADLAWCCTSFCHSLNTKTNFQESPYLIFLTEVSMVCNLRMNTFRKSLPSLKCRGQCYKGNWAQKNKNYLSVTFSQREAIIVTSAIICSTYVALLVFRLRTYSSNSVVS